MTDESSPKAGSPALRQEIRSILGDGGTAEDLANQLDFSDLVHLDEYASWHLSTPMEDMLRIHFLRYLLGWNHAEAARYTEDEEAQTSLGLSGSVSRSTASRAWTNRFTDDLRFVLRRHSEASVQVAEEMGHSLAVRIAEEQTNGSSKATEARLTRKYLREIPPTVLRLVGSDIDFIPDRARNSQYPLSQFLDIESRIGITNGAIEDGCKQYRISTDGSSPGGDIFRHYLKQSSLTDLLEQFETANQTIITAAKQRLNFSRPATVAIDITPVPYYGTRRDEYVIESPPSKDYPHQQDFAAISIIGENVRVILGFRRRKQGESLGKVVRELLDTASGLVNIHRVYADRAFATAEVVEEVESRRVKYAIPVPKNERIRHNIRRMKHDVEVIHEYGIYGATRDGSSRGRVETTLALIPSSRNPSKTIPFYTNEDISDESGVEREWAERWLNKYRYRWGIETAFKSVKQFLPVTASNDDRVRVFHFGFAVMLYNLWRLIDYLVRKEVRGEVDYGETPLVTAGQFREALRSYTGFE